ncbi:response regulator receiver modulated PilZ sensor protein [Citrifermentans bremense]|uniref:Response regulator receiver modulated PilZ sensor protein n=1 Tax=Citrifermentans bremense TaxID=60035 RepID=A0A6S6LZB8_9BACT|nr:response regulator [Citrifermentans bremense]BCG46669.1 response regulator receiver modulated PilZ sensor protein [Citrifermentans bremense]
MASKVLLVDDVSMFIELEKDYLQLSAVTVLTARDGEEALRICRLERPELVFMDLHMPLMNGADCCREIKRDQRLSTAVILITSEGKEEDRQLCLRAGCDGFLTKPLDRHAFLEAARKLLPAIDRRDRRVNCRFNAKFRAFGLTLSGFASNLSQNGMYVAADADLEEDAVVELIFALPEPFGTIIQTRARIAWQNSSKNRKKPALPPGFGVEFLFISEDEREQIGRFVDSLDKVSARV